MMGSFVRDCMLPGLGMCAVVVLVAVFVVWLGLCHQFDCAFG